MPLCLHFTVRGAWGLLESRVRLFGSPRSASNVRTVESFMPAGLS